MKNLLTKLRYVPKRFGMVAALMLASASVAVTFAWGPARDTFTMAHPADHVVFNSITDNPNYGDEREFVIVRDLTTGASYSDTANLVPGHEYKVQLYVHNNARTDLNASGKGVAKDTTVRVVVPASVTGSDTVDGFVKATNADPKEVWDTAELKSANKVDLEFVSGSAHLSTHAQQVSLPDSILTTGVKVGDKDLSGDWRGCLEYAGVVTFKFRVKQPPTNDFTMDKQVRKHSETTGGWVDNYKAEPNEVVDFIIRYKNTGEVVQKNVNVKDTLPTGMVYVAGSTVLANSNQPNGASVADGVVAGGINIGDYAPGANAWVRFKARVVTNVHLPECGHNTLKNVGFVKTDAGTKNDDATVTVTKVCDNPSAVCKSLTANTISRTEFSFDGEATVENGATVSKYTFVVKNSAGVVVKTVNVNSTALKANSGKVTLTDVGVYTVQLSVTTSVGVKDGPNCKTTVEVKPEVEDKDISVCRLSDKKMIQIKESVYNQNPSLYSKNPSDCDAPKELPSTGPGTIVGGLFGSSALGLGISSYVRSRGAVRSLLNR